MDQKVIGRIPEALVSKLFILIKELKAHRAYATRQVEKLKAPERNIGTWWRY